MKRLTILFSILLVFVILSTSYLYRNYVYVSLMKMDKPVICKYVTKWMVSDATNEETILFLINCLESETWGCRFYVMRALERIDRDLVIKLLIENIKNKNETARLHILNLLSKLNATEAADEFISHLSDENEIIRAEAAKALGKIKHEEAIEKLYYLVVNDESELVQSSSAYSLSRLGDKRAIPYLLDFLKSSNTSVKMNAILGLSNNKENRKIVSELIKCIEASNDYYVRYQAIAALEKITSKGIKDLTGKDKAYWLRGLKPNG